MTVYIVTAARQRLALPESDATEAYNHPWTTKPVQTVRPAARPANEALSR